MARLTTNGTSGEQLSLADPRADQPVSEQSFPFASTRWELSGSVAPDSPMQRVCVMAQPFTVGRDPENSLPLADPTISRRHAELLRAGGNLLIRDLASRNGTYLNGRRVQNFERLQGGDILQFGGAIFTVHPCDAGQVPASDHGQCLTADADVCDTGPGTLEFGRLLTEPAVIPHFQPIVRLATNHRVGYEVLARSRLIGLETPSAMFRAAAERNLEVELSHLIRRESLRIARQVGLTADLYLNTHPAELLRPDFVESLRRLRREFSESGIVVEIHESTITSTKAISDLRAALRDLNMRLAYDDFGAGQSRLMELADVPPDVLKFDLRQIHGLSCASDERQKLVRSMVRIARSLNVIPLAEGIETGDEAVVSRELGFELAQGYYYGRPSAAPARGAPETVRITGRKA